MENKNEKYILWFSEISKKDVALVGGKNASLGEMFSKLTRKAYPRQRRGGPSKANIWNRGINIPDGFALTTKAYWHFIKENRLDKKLKEIFASFDPQSIENLQRTGKFARKLILDSQIPKDLKRNIIKAYQKLCREYGQNYEVAVRSSGVAEDSPTTSFAGQFETFLNIKGEKKLLWAVKQSLASTFTDRAIAYRDQNKIPQLKFALSIGVQKMVRSDLACSGIIFTIDTESGFTNVVVINGIYGVGEMIVKGRITPDEFQVFKPMLYQTQDKFYKPIIVKNLGRKTEKFVFSPASGLKKIAVNKTEQSKFCLKDEEILTLARWAILIEKHYCAPQDIEWAKDGKTGQLFIVQSRPETVQAAKSKTTFEEYKLKSAKPPILKGIAVGNKIGQGKARIINDISKIKDFQKGEILITKMTDPDWLPALRIAAGVITDEGGRTSHAAIISRELGIPAVVGTKSATKETESGNDLTVDCSTGQGLIFKGKIAFSFRKYDLRHLPKTKTKVMVNIGAPEIAYKTSFLPAAGVGLARTEFILAEKIKIHPLSLYYFKTIKNKELKIKINELTVGYKDKKQFFIDELSEGISQIAAAFWPRPVIVRLSDLKTNEYKALIGGEIFEPDEANPMIGFRGASRYYDEKFQPAFEMECQAIKKAREIFGLKNIKIMVPFCRTPEEGKKVIQLMESNGLKKGKDGLKIIVMCEVPSNVILADEFLKIFDGMSIGSNDLTQLVLGLDRDNANLAQIGDEKNEAVKEMIANVIQTCRKSKKYVGICGDAPSTFPDFTEFLVKEGIESISVSPDALVKTIINVAKTEKHV